MIPKLLGETTEHQVSQKYHPSTGMCGPKPKNSGTYCNMNLASMLSERGQSFFIYLHEESQIVKIREAELEE